MKCRDELGSFQKIFAKINRRNNQWLAYPGDIPVVARMKFPANVHVLSVVSLVKITSPRLYFFKKEETHKKVYLRVLMNVVKTVASGRSYVFQQVHWLIRVIQNWLVRQRRYVLVKEFWPPNSSDLNPLDYYVWSVVERVTNKSRHSM